MITVQKITQQEIAERAVSNMAIRPNDRSSYGAGGLSPSEVRARFDALVLLVIERFNELLDEIDAGNIGGDGDAVEKLNRDISSGALAGYMQVYDDGGALNALQNVLNNIFDGAVGGPGEPGEPGEPGKDGVGIVKIEQTTTSTADGGLNEITVTLTDGNTYVFTVMNGKQGSPGDPGSPGSPGSPGADGVGIAKIEQIEVSVADSGVNVYRITLTNGTYTDIHIKNGSKGGQGDPGTPGAPGEEGFSPSVEVIAIDGGHRVTVTDKYGTKTFDVMDGAASKGSRGSGILKVTTAPTSYTTATGGKNPIKRMSISTIKSQANVDEVVINDHILYGSYLYHIYYLDSTYAYMDSYTYIKGQTGQPGDDYVLTEADKDEVANLVLAKLPTWDGGSY